MKTAHAIGEAYGLQHWAATLGPVAQRTKGAGGMKRQKTVDEGLKKELLKVLLEVYMSAGCVDAPRAVRVQGLTRDMGGSESNADRTARLLNSQAINIDVLDVSSSPESFSMTLAKKKYASLALSHCRSSRSFRMIGTSTQCHHSSRVRSGALCMQSTKARSSRISV